MNGNFRQQIRRDIFKIFDVALGNDHIGHASGHGGEDFSSVIKMLQKKV